MDINLVIFDCDGVLIDSERLALMINQEIMAEVGWGLSREQIVERFMGRSYDHMYGAIAEQIGRPVPDDAIERWSRAYRQLLAAEVKAVPDVRAAIDELQTAGYRTCVASSGGHPQIRVNLTTAGLYDYFEGEIFSASEVEHGKPAPDLFLHAAAAMGVEPVQCVVVEDSLWGVQAARAAGMAVLAYAGSDMTAPASLSDAGAVVFGDMRKLPELIRAL